jgi:flagellar biosynthesis GTPase FlhF
MAPEDQDTFTYRGRSLEELVPRIRQELGDDAVIVSRRETTSGGVGGFFAKREIEVDVRPGEMAGPSSRVAEAFAAQLADAHARQQQAGGPGDPAGAIRPTTAPEVDALPGAADLTVNDLFPTPPPQNGGGLASLFNVGLPPAEPAVAMPSDADEPEAAAPPVPARPEIIEDEDEWDDEEWGEEPALEIEEAEEVPEPAPAPAPVSEIPHVEQPTGAFDYVGVGEPAASEPAPVASSEPAPAPEPFASPASTTPAHAGLPPAVLVAAERLVARGLRAGLAEAIAEEAMSGLAPLRPEADPKQLLTDALARRIPMHPLRRGPGVIGFVGPGGAGKTRCVARLAAAHARHGVLPVTVVALRSPDGGAELRRLLAPYGVALHAIESGAEGAARTAALRGSGLVIVDTPGVSPRSSGELRALGFELDSLAPDELHLAVPATIGPAAAQELVGGLRELGVGALALTHTDETEMLGTVVGLAIDSGLPLSYLARGQAVEAGLRPASAIDLASDLVP